MVLWSEDMRVCIRGPFPNAPDGPPKLLTLRRGPDDERVGLGWYHAGLFHVVYDAPQVAPGETAEAARAGSTKFWAAAEAERVTS